MIILEISEMTSYRYVESRTKRGPGWILVQGELTGNLNWGGGHKRVRLRKLTELCRAT